MKMKKLKKQKNEKKWEKKPTKLSWPMSAKSDKNFFYSERKKAQNYHGPWVPNLILSYQALYITK